MARHIDPLARPIDKDHAVQDQANQAVHHLIREMPAVPLEEVPLGTQMFCFPVAAGVRDDWHVPLVCVLEQSSHLPEVLVRRADVVLQPELFALAALWQHELLQHDFLTAPLPTPTPLT